MGIKKETILSILNLFFFFLMFLITKGDRRAVMFFPLVYTILKPPYSTLKVNREIKCMISLVVTIVIYLVYWR